MKKTVALIGCGYWGSKIQKYIPEVFNLKHTANSKINLNTIWKDPDIEGVIIATPVETHYDIAKAALLSNKHIFVEKPITAKTHEAKDLKNIADINNLKIGVNYVQTFSPSINKAISLIPEIGKLKFIEMSTKHLGRFMNWDVYYLLASHHLSILDMITDIKDLELNTACYMDYNDMCTTGSITFAKFNGHCELVKDPCDFRGRIDVSINFPGKEMLINIYGSEGTIKYNALTHPPLTATWYNKGYASLPDKLTDIEKKWDFDEMNNLALAMKYFDEIMEGKTDSNIDRAIKITNILEQIKRY